MSAVWGEWTRLTTGATGKVMVVAARRPDQRVETLVTQVDGADSGELTQAAFVWADAAEPVTSTPWRPTSTFPTRMMLRRQSGTITAFGTAATGQMATRVQRPDGSWQDWTVTPLDAEEGGLCFAAVNEPVPGPPSGPGAAFDFVAGGFFVTSDQHIWQLREERPDGPWEFHQLYTDTNRLVSLAAVARPDHRVEVIGVAPNGTVFRTFQTEPAGAWTGHWSRLYSATDTVGSLTAAINAEGRLEVFGVSRGGGLVHTWEEEPGGGWNGRWVPFVSDGQQIRQLHAVRRADGRISLFGLASEPADDDVLTVWSGPSRSVVRHLWQTTDDGDWNGAWSALPQQPTALSVQAITLNEHATFDLFAADTSGGLWRTRQRDV